MPNLSIHKRNPSSFRLTLHFLLRNRSNTVASTFSRLLLSRVPFVPRFLLSRSRRDSRINKGESDSVVMKLFIELRDHDEHLHGDFEWTFNIESTVDEIKEKVASVLVIKHEYQQLFFHGSRLRANTLRDAGIKDGDTIAVRHSLAERWRDCQIHFENVQKATHEYVKSEISRRGLKQLHCLEDLDFFDVYNFGQQYDEMIQVFSQNTCERETRSEVAVKRRKVDTPEIYPAGETHPEHIDGIKHLLFQAIDDNGQDAIVTVINATHAVASFHCFESYVDGSKHLEIRNVFNPSKIFTLRAVKSCRASVCQVILFESESKLMKENERAPQINLPLWGRQYYVLGLPGESRLFHEGRTHRLSYLSGSVTSVYYADEGKALRIVGDSGSRPGFSGGPLINLLYGDLIGFCVGGGPCAEDIDGVCEKFEHARFLIATPSSHVKNWAHSECESSPNTSASS